MGFGTVNKFEYNSWNLSCSFTGTTPWTKNDSGHSEHLTVPRQFLVYFKEETSEEV